jgi:ribulose kinase
VSEPTAFDIDVETTDERVKQLNSEVTTIRNAVWDILDARAALNEYGMTVSVTVDEGVIDDYDAHVEITDE